MSYLILDTSTPYYVCMVATFENVQFSHIERYPPKEASGLFLEKVFDGLESVGLSAADIKAIIVTNGPGSLTALRTGISVAQGIASAHQLPVYVLGSMALYAKAVGKPVLMDARCGYFYHFYEGCQNYPKMCGLSELSQISGGFAVAGDWPFSDGAQQVIAEENSYLLHQAALALIKNIEPVSASEISAFYLKPAVNQ
jgi:tRNA threonylcarbamoyladenosine biosynthesis protein TsaB